MGPDLYDCASCAATPYLYEMLGHDGPPAPGLWEKNLITGEPLARCPIRALQLAKQHEPALASEMERMRYLYYPQWEQGNLLVEGGLADQPNRYIDAMLTIEHYEAVAATKHDELTRTDESRK